MEVVGKEWKILASESYLVYHPGYPPQTQEIIDITGITDEMLQAEGKPPMEAMLRLNSLLQECDYAMAHKKVFDQTIANSLSARLGFVLEEKPWICTLSDLPWHSKFRCHRLSHLALDVGLKMDHRSLHRASDDVALMLELVFSQWSIEEIMDYIAQPWAYLKADILPPWKDPIGNAQAKKLNYTFEKAKGTDFPVYEKTWVKRVKVNQVEREKDLAPFRVIVL